MLRKKKRQPQAVEETGVAETEAIEVKARHRAAFGTNASVLAIGIALIIVVANFLLFSAQTQLFAAVNAVAAIVALTLPVWSRFAEFRKLSDMENNFPAFMEDTTTNINAGMSLPQAIRTASDNYYGRLTPLVKEAAAKLEWGIPFDKVLEDFADKTGSKVIARASRGIIEAHNSGGKIGTVLSSMATSVSELARIRKERSASVYGQMVTGYFIFFIFIGIMLALAKLLIPSLTINISPTSSVGDLSAIYSQAFRAMVAIQGLFAGLGVGKMSEGTIVAGFKHSFVLAVVGYTVFVIF